MTGKTLFLKAQAMNFIKRKKQDKIYWIPSTQLGEIKFTFDKIKIYEFYKDYPQELRD